MHWKKRKLLNWMVLLLEMVIMVLQECVKITTSGLRRCLGSYLRNHSGPENPSTCSVASWCYIFSPYFRPLLALKTTFFLLKNDRFYPLYSPEATVIPIWKTAICKWGVCKWAILKHPIFNVLNFRSWIKLIFDTVD